MSPLAVTTPSVSPICPKCGTMKNSARPSCCGQGGSWFGNCGGVGNTNHGHTWHEGIQACKARQSQAAVGQQLHRASQPKSDPTFVNSSISVDTKEVIVTAHILASTRSDTSTNIPATAGPIVHFINTTAVKPMHSVLFVMSTTAPSHDSDNMSSTARKFEIMLVIAIHIMMTVIMVY